MCETPECEKSPAEIICRAFSYGLHTLQALRPEAMASAMVPRIKFLELSIVGQVGR